MAGKGIELAVAYVSVVGETKQLYKDVESAFDGISSDGGKYGKDLGKKLSDGVKSEMSSGSASIAKTLARELGQAGDEGSKALLRELSAGNKEAERNAAAAAKNYANALKAGMAGGGSESARKFEAEFRSALNARNSSQAFFDEFEKSGNARAQAVGNAVGLVIGKSIGFALKGSLTVGALGVTDLVGGVGLALTKGFQRLKTIDEATFKLKALGNSAKDVQQIVDSATKAVKGTAFGLDEAITGAASAVAAGVKPGKDLQQYLSEIADTAAIAGTSFEDMASIFNNIQTNGKAYTDDLQQLSDRGINVFKYLATQYGVTSDELAKMVQDGKVSSADFLTAIQTNIGGAGKIMGQSFTGSMQNAEAAIGRLGEALLKPVFGEAAGGVGNITSALDDLSAWVKNHQDDIIGFWEAVGKGAVSGTQDVLQAVAEIIGAFGGLQDFLGNILGGVNKFQAWQADFRGDHDVANELRAQAEEFFAWGDSAKGAEAKIREMIQGLDGTKDKIGKWGDKAKAAAEITQALGDSIVSIPDGKTITIEDNAPSVEGNLDKLGIKLTTLPDGKVTLTPNTPEAQAKIDAFIAKNNPAPPMTAPLDVDTSEASRKMAQFIDQWTTLQGIPVPGTGVPRQNPLTGPTGGAPQNPLLAPYESSAPGYVQYDPSKQQDALRRAFGHRAVGGGIYGSGPKGRDSVPIMAAPGEHMLTAADVDAMGGQGGVYAFRQALHNGGVPGLAGGGAVDWMLASPGIPSDPRRNADRKNPSDFGDRGPETKKRHRLEPPFQYGGEKPGTSIWPGGEGGWGGIPWWGGKLLVKPPSERRKPMDPYERNRKHVGALGDSVLLPGYEGGGAIAAIDYAYNDAGKPYQYGSFDCSMYMSQIYARMAGLPAGRYFNTESDFAALGFKKGYKAGALNVGIAHGGGGQNSHMGGTLPNGVNVENNGSNGSMYGPGAKGAQDFTDQWYYDGPSGMDMALGAPQQQSGTDPNTTTHGLAMGAAPGPAPDQAGAPADAASDRTAGYIPVGASSTGVPGTSFVSGLLNMGAEAVNGVIDQAASAASSAASIGVNAVAPGAGGAAQFGIGLATSEAKRGVSYGFQLLGIGADSLIENVFSPFGGAPRWLGYDYTQFAPHLGSQPVGVTTGEKAGQDFAGQQASGSVQGTPPAPGGPVQPGQLPGAQPVTPGSPPALFGDAAPTPPPPQDDWRKQLLGGVYDTGGVLPHQGVAVNLSGQPEHVLTGKQWDAMYANATAWQAPPPDQSRSGATYNVYASDADEAVRRLRSKEKLDAMQYGGRPW